MAKAILILIAFTAAFIAPVSKPADQSAATQQQAETALMPQERAIKVTIATVGNPMSSPVDHYRVGEQIPVTISMTSTFASPQSVCISSDLYQNLPKLTKDGRPMPYMKWQSDERLNVQRDHTCKEDNLPEPVILKPNEPTLADWFVLVEGRVSTGAEPWYEPLLPGKYELSIQRRLRCCDGPMIESNKVSFEVVP
jgi:hypothetical protein